MTLLNLIPLRVRERTEPASVGRPQRPADGCLLLGLVFVPIIGLHIAAVAFDPEATAPSPDNLAHHVDPAGKPTRG